MPLLDDYCLVIGGANMDIIGSPARTLLAGDSNPGHIRISCGGVGRNIAENLARLGLAVKLITAVGDDLHGRKLLAETRAAGVDVCEMSVFQGEATPIYLAILNEQGEMSAAINQMTLLDRLGPEEIKEKTHILQHAALIVLDTNLKRDLLAQVPAMAPSTPIFLDTVSVNKADKARELLPHVHTLKPNLAEAEHLAAMTVTTQADLGECTQRLLDQGVGRVFISLGAEGLYYSDGHACGHVANPDGAVVNTTGAGDALMAGLAYGHQKGYTTEQSARFAVAAAVLATAHGDTINPTISAARIKTLLEDRHPSDSDRRESLAKRQRMRIKDD